MLRPSVSARISQRYAEMVTGKIGYRTDLHLSDFQVMNKKAARVLIGYAHELGKPDSAQVEQFVNKVFSGKLGADLTNARNKPKYNVVECILAIPERVRPYTDSKKLTAIVAGARFLDTNLGDVWETEAFGEKGKRLIRVSKDNINDILLAHRRSMRSLSGLVTFASIGEEAGDLELAKDDYVTAYYNGKHTNAVVASVGNDTVKVRFPTGKVVALAKTAITGVEMKSSKHTPEHIKALRDFYAQFLPTDMVDKLYPPAASEKNLA